MIIHVKPIELKNAVNIMVSTLVENHNKISYYQVKKHVSINKYNNKITISISYEGGKKIIWIHKEKFNYQQNVIDEVMYLVNNYLNGIK